MKPIHSLDCYCHKLAEGTGAENQSGAVDRKGLEAMLQKLQTVDLDSVSRVSDSKVRQRVK